MQTEITCPHCRETIDKLVLKKLPVDDESRHKALLLCCPKCLTPLPAHFDPVSVAAASRYSLLDELKDHLAKQA